MRPCPDARQPAQCDYPLSACGTSTRPLGSLVSDVPYAGAPIASTSLLARWPSTPPSYARARSLRPLLLHCHLNLYGYLWPGLVDYSVHSLDHRHPDPLTDG